MLKLVGALCVVIGAGALGAHGVFRLRERVRVLRRLLEAVSFLEEELSFRLTPLPTLLDKLSHQTEGAVGRFFAGCRSAFLTAPEAGFRQSWERAMAENLPMLAEEEREALMALGAMLGRYDSEGQRNALKHTAARLEACLAAACEERDRLGRVYAVVSTAAGLLAVIVLM